MKIEKTRLAAVFGTDKMLSESAAGIKLTYLGPDLKISGHKDWNIEFERGDVYELVQAKDARAIPFLRYRHGRETIDLKCPREELMRVLCASKFPRNVKRRDVVYTVPNTKQPTFSVKATNIVTTNKWHIEEASILEQNGKHYFEFDTRVPMEKYMTAYAITRVLTSMRKQQQETTTAPKAPQVAAETKPNMDVEQPTIAKPVKDADAGVSYGYVVAISSLSDVGQSWAVKAANNTKDATYLAALTIQASHAAANTLAKEMRVYRVIARSQMLQQLQQPKLIPDSELNERARLLRTVEIKARTEAKHPENHYPIPDVNDPRLTAVSWSSYDVNKVHAALRMLFQAGMFGQIVPRATTKGLVFDYPANMEAPEAKQHVIGSLRRIYSYFRLMSPDSHQDINVVVAYAPHALRARFEFPELSAKQRESIDLLLRNPPLLNAPIYRIAGQSPVYAITDFDKATGNVSCCPVRGVSKPDNKTASPDTLLYSKKRNVLYTSIVRYE